MYTNKIAHTHILYNQAARSLERLLLTTCSSGGLAERGLSSARGVGSQTEAERESSVDASSPVVCRPVSAVPGPVSLSRAVSNSMVVLL